MLLDREGHPMPIVVQVSKNFAGEKEEAFYNPTDQPFSETIFPLYLEPGESHTLTSLHLFQNWGRHMTKHWSSLGAWMDYFHRLDRRDRDDLLRAVQVCRIGRCDDRRFPRHESGMLLGRPASARQSGRTQLPVLLRRQGLDSSGLYGNRLSQYGAQLVRYRSALSDFRRQDQSERPTFSRRLRTTSSAVISRFATRCSSRWKSPMPARIAAS